MRRADVMTKIPRVIDTDGKEMPSKFVREILRDLHTCYLCPDRSYTVRMWKPEGKEAALMRQLFMENKQSDPDNPALYVLCRFHALRPDADLEVQQHLLAAARQAVGKWN